MSSERDARPERDFVINTIKTLNAEPLITAAFQRQENIAGHGNAYQLGCVLTKTS